MASPKTDPLTVPIWHASIIDRQKRIRVVINNGKREVEWVDPYFDYDAGEWRCKISGVPRSIVGYGTHRKGWDIFYIRHGSITDKNNQALRAILEDWYIEIQRVFSCWRDEKPFNVDQDLISRMVQSPRWDPLLKAALDEILRFPDGQIPSHPNGTTIEAVVNWLRQQNG